MDLRNRIKVFNQMTIKSNSTKTCQFCGYSFSADESHEEFDFFKHADKKKDLYALQSKLKELGRATGSTVWSFVDEYAIQRKIKSDSGVVLPAFARLTNAFQWLVKLEKIDTDIDSSRPQPAIYPF